MDPTEVPDFGLASLGYDSSSGLYVLHHRVTGESVKLPSGDKPPQLIIDGDSGFGMIARGGEEEWLSAYLQCRLIEDPESKSRFVMDASGELHSLQDYRSRHDKESFRMCIADESKEFVLYRFATPWGGARVWWSVASWFHAAMIETSQKPGHWLHSLLASWERSCGQRGLASCHVRRATETEPVAKKIKLEGGGSSCLRERILPETTLSTFALLHVLIRLARPARNKHADDPKSARNAHRWRLLLFSVLGLFYHQDFELELFNDERVTCSPGEPLAGQWPFVASVRRGRVDLQTFSPCSACLPPVALGSFSAGRDMFDFVLELAGMGNEVRLVVESGHLQGRLHGRGFPRGGVPTTTSGCGRSSAE